MLAQVPLRDDQTYIPGLLNSQGTKVGCMGCLSMALPLLPPPCTAPAVAASERNMQHLPSGSRGSNATTSSICSGTPGFWSTHDPVFPQVRLTFKAEVQQLWVGSATSTQASGRSRWMAAVPGLLS